MEQSLVIKEGLTLETIKNTLVRGNGKVTDQEATMFLKLCENRNLNPFINEAYLIKFGTSPATMIVSKDVFVRRAYENPNCNGWKAGIVVYNLESKQLEEREGTIWIKDIEVLAGGWCEVYFKDKKYTIKQTVSLKEYDLKQSSWTSKPATMIRKVAIVQALREAFPVDFSQMYDESEIEEPKHIPKEKVLIDIPEKEIEHQPNNKIDPGF